MVEMSETGDPGKDAGSKSRVKGLLVALAGALVAGGGGFVASYGGYLDGIAGGGGGAPAIAERTYSFVPLDTLMISLGPRARAETLKFTAQLEVENGTEEVVAAMSPRILDVLNSYLRAVEEAELEDPAALALLRAQMLRRIQIVVGEGKVRDLLIAEFILN